MADTTGEARMAEVLEAPEEADAPPCPVAETMRRIQRDLDRDAATTFEALLAQVARA